jgi:predicted dehydrogenase
VTQNLVEVRIHGSEGMLTFVADAGAPDAQTGRILGARGGEPVASRVPIPPSYVGGLHETPRSDTRLRVSYGRLAAELLEAIREGRQATPSFHDGVRVQEVLDTVLESSRTGGWVTVERSASRKALATAL